MRDGNERNVMLKYYDTQTQPKVIIINRRKTNATQVQQMHIIKYKKQMDKRSN